MAPCFDASLGTPSPVRRSREGALSVSIATKSLPCPGDAYRKAWEACKLEGDTPNVQAIQELVTAFKLPWKWRRKG